MTPPKFTFDYVVTVAEGAGPFATRLRAAPPEEDRARLVGPAPALAVGAARPLADRLPRGVELAGLPVCELTLRAGGPEDATVEWASFELPEAVWAAFAPGDELRLVRPAQSDLALRLRRDGRLLLAAGALLEDDRDPVLRAEPEGDAALRVEIEGASATVAADPVELAGFVVSAPGPRPRSMLGRAACVAIARAGFCEAPLAAAAALLLHHGPFRTLAWVRGRRR